MEGRRNAILLKLVRCRGHPDVQLLHKSTLEFTPDKVVTIRGDCIFCVESMSTLLVSEKDPVDHIIQNAVIEIIVMPPPWSKSEPMRLSVKCNSICNPDGIILRKSGHCDKRTLAIQCDAAAKDIRMNIDSIASDSFTKIYIIVKGC